jgi:glutamine---fructose-6-phosphate transaminase (isomerizing)
VFATPIMDRSWCHTVGYVSPILAGWAIAAAIAGQAEDPAVAQWTLNRALGARNEAAAVASALHGVDHLVAVGSGTDRIACREFALKVEEGVRLPASGLDLETFLHGHLAACSDRTGVVLFLTDLRRGGQRAARGLQLLRAARRVGCRTAAVVDPVLSDPVLDEACSVGRIVGAQQPARPELASETGLSATLMSLLHSTIALQLLTLELAHLAGTNPDLIRREEGPYREAAAIAESMQLQEPKRD